MNTGCENYAALNFNCDNCDVLNLVRESYGAMNPDCVSYQ